MSECFIKYLIAALPPDFYTGKNKLKKKNHKYTKPTVKSCSLFVPFIFLSVVTNPMSDSSET